MKGNTVKHAITGVALSLLVFGLAHAQDGPPPAPVEVAIVAKKPLSPVSWAPGTIVARNDAQIAAEISGRLLWVADVGARVEKGDVLARIDSRSQDLALRDAVATIRRLQADLEYRNSQLSRLEDLAAENNAARNQIDEARAQRDMVAQDLVQARVSRERAQYRLSLTEVQAPFPGQVAERMRQAGEYISTGGSMMRLVDIGHTEVRVQAPISAASFLTENTLVLVKDRAQESMNRVRTVIPVGDEQSRLIEVRVELDDPSWVIGSAVRVALPQSTPTEVIAVPRDALILREEATFVFRVTEEGKVERITVEPGMGQGAVVEVNGDLTAGDQVVIRGGERLRDGQSIRIM